MPHVRPGSGFRLRLRLRPTVPVSAAEGLNYHPNPFGDHFDSLVELGLELDEALLDPYSACFEILSEVVKPSSQGEAGPTVLDVLEQADADDVPGPGVLALPLFGGAVNVLSPFSPMLYFTNDGA